MEQVTRTPRLLGPLALSVILIAGAHPGAVAEQTPGPPPPSSAANVTGSLTGIVADRDGSTIAGAQVTLTFGRQPTPDSATVRTAGDGRFTFSNLPPGPFRLSVDAEGFSPRQISGELQPSESRDLDSIALHAGSSTDIQVSASKGEVAEAEIRQEEKQRVLGIIPNYFVVYESNPAPLAPRQKFELAWKTQIDPVSFALTGVIAGAEQATHTYAWELGASGYAKRYAASYGTFLTGNFLSDAVFPTIFKQDPRYFYKGTGSVRSRMLYAIANAVICKGDNQHWQLNYSGILGGLAASGISNLYYPRADRNGAALTFEGAAIGTGFVAFGNLMQEFVIRKLTPHTPARPKP